jgi:hypothetical protein
MLEYVYNFISVCTIGIIAWAFRISNRVTKVEVVHEGLKELITVRFDAQDARFERLEKQLNGHLRKE